MRRGVGGNTLYCLSYELIPVKINGSEYQLPQSLSILDACVRAGVRIPTLCYLEDVAKNASCGVCLVEVKGARTLVRSCSTCVHEGIEISTSSPRVREARKTNVELLLANHPKDCLSCLRNQSCELQALAADLGVQRERFIRTKQLEECDTTSPSLVRDPNKCIEPLE